MASDRYSTAQITKYFDRLGLPERHRRYSVADRFPEQALELELLDMCMSMVVVVMVMVMVLQFGGPMERGIARSTYTRREMSRLSRTMLGDEQILALATPPRRIHPQS